MKAYERILLIARPDLQRSAAMRQAAWLARETGAALHIAVFDHSATLDLVARLRAEDLRGLRDTFLRQRRDWLTQQAEELERTGIKVTTEAVWSRHAADEILAHVLETKADLVIKDADSHKGLRRLLMTSLDWQLLRECPAPLMLVHGDHLTPRRIVVAADVMSGSGDALNEKVVRQAEMVAEAAQAELHLAYAFQAIAPIEAVAPMAVPALTGELYDSLRQIHEEAFETFADAEGVPDAQRHFLAGPAAPALVGFAEKIGADLLVMGTTHRTRLERIVIGSTAAALLDHLPCSVLVIKPDGLAEALSAQITARLNSPARSAA
ncbi:universal stress protein [Solimonas variicoloris]|uniref:universal stress protein n=1 Tax=Solimonas variicoloris TaxID=254408 RepID=UPI00035CA942|nr:universal stress protein [Solimonas variicoloris]